MIKLSKDINIEPPISKPTKEVIANVVEKLKEKYEIIVTKADAIKYAKLSEELGWLLYVEKGCDSHVFITREIAEEMKTIIKKRTGKAVTLEQALLEAKKSLIITAASEKERVANEIRAIIAKYKV